ncbi:HNH endonuclease signature motif containing protein [Micromonospora sp. NPDC048887]|uniref:HNH endonuclease signature motif containing protein n=1 Tax=Micromonospora sp. NPDC048887 TaxID=3155614 RepID=UPI0033E12937
MRAAFLAANPRCHECGAHATHVDHTIPVSSRPDLLMDVDNWRPHCATCSARQGARIANSRRNSGNSKRPSARPDPYSPDVL